MSANGRSDKPAASARALLIALRPCASAPAHSGISVHGARSYWARKFASAQMNVAFAPSAAQRLLMNLTEVR